MPKRISTAALHEPLAGILGTQGKLAALRILAGTATPLTFREVTRRSGMAYRSIDLALTDLLATGVVEQLPGGRERRVRIHAGHRLAPVLAALLRAEGDFFPALRTELRLIGAGGEREGLLVVALVGPAATRTERLGEGVELVLVANDLAAAERWALTFERGVEALQGKFGATVRVIGYDLPAAKRLWQNRTGRAEAMVRSAESLIGPRLLSVVESL